MSQVIQRQPLRRHPSPQPHLWQRLWRYQQERFPLLKHSLLIAAFSFCAVCLSALLRGQQEWPAGQTAITAFVCLLLFFLQLRIADEFKDYTTDAQYRPERPVPRGLVRLRELGWLGLGAALVQLLLVWWLHPPLLLLLSGVWLYMAFMRVEFGLGAWLQQRPVAYLLSHMLIVPLIDLFATACDWLPASPRWFASPPEGLTWFLLISFLNGIVVEIGRKTWAPSQERAGVESYSSAWGIRRAVSVWFGAVLLAFFCACFLAQQIAFLLPVVVTLLVLLSLLGWFGFRFVQQPTPAGAARLEALSGLWVVGLYLVLGVLPLGVQLWLR